MLIISVSPSFSSLSSTAFRVKSEKLRNMSASINRFIFT